MKTLIVKPEKHDWAFTIIPTLCFNYQLTNGEHQFDIIISIFCFHILFSFKLNMEAIAEIILFVGIAITSLIVLYFGAILS